jgi:thiosulfate reductase cytochrome b subunit
MATEDPVPGKPTRATQRVYRHSLAVRLFHWVNALCFVILLMSGLQIFAAYPRLHWGDTGYAGMPAIFEITGAGTLDDPRSWIQIGSHRIYTTGFLGVPKVAPYLGVTNWAFPPWMTLPSGVLALGYGRGWHFLTAWIFSFNLGWYWTYAWCSGRVKRELLPTRAQLRLRAILHDLWHHARLKRHTGLAARHYNFLQRLAYLFVLFVLLPNQILSGMTLSNTAVAVFPWLIALFDGRQSARTLHFIGAMLLLLFLLIHIFQVFVAGFMNEIRSMITGHFIITRERHE